MRGSLHEHLGTRAPGISGHIVFLRSGKLRGTCASGRFNVRSLFLSLRSVPCTLPYDEAGSPFQNLILLILLENLVLPQPMSNEVSFLFSSFCSVLSYPGSVPTQLLRLFVTLWWWFYNYGLFSYSSYSKHAHIGSSDHYASFLLAPAEA